MIDEEMSNEYIANLVSDFLLSVELLKEAAAKSNDAAFIAKVKMILASGFETRVH